MHRYINKQSSCGVCVCMCESECPCHQIYLKRRVGSRSHASGASCRQMDPGYLGRPQPTRVPKAKHPGNVSRRTGEAPATTWTTSSVDPTRWVPRRHRTWLGWKHAKLSIIFQNNNVTSADSGKDNKPREFPSVTFTIKPTAGERD